MSEPPVLIGKATRQAYEDRPCAKCPRKAEHYVVALQDFVPLDKIWDHDGEYWCNRCLKMDELTNLKQQVDKLEKEVYGEDDYCTCELATIWNDPHKRGECWYSSQKPR